MSEVNNPVQIGFFTWTYYSDALFNPNETAFEPDQNLHPNEPYYLYFSTVNNRWQISDSNAVNYESEAHMAVGGDVFNPSAPWYQTSNGNELIGAFSEARNEPPPQGGYL